MIVKLLTKHHLEFLSLKGGCRGSFESTHVKMPHCWKSHALAHILFKDKHKVVGDINLLNLYKFAEFVGQTLNIFVSPYTSQFYRYGSVGRKLIFF